MQTDPLSASTTIHLAAGNFTVKTRFIDALGDLQYAALSIMDAQGGAVPLTIFFPISRRDQVERIAAVLDEIAKA